jgi:hypothetical protein
MAVRRVRRELHNVEKSSFIRDLFGTYGSRDRPCARSFNVHYFHFTSVRHPNHISMYSFDLLLAILSIYISLVREYI